jgi:UDP-galactopyranose mutase
VEGIQVHEYGAHIFHTSNKEVWDYVNRFAEFNRYTNSPVARYRDELYNLPFNMNTFHALWGVRTPKEAREEIDRQTAEARASIPDPDNPANVEEQALLLAGRDIYEKLVKGYTEKQWGRRADSLPAFIIKRLPFRFTYDNNYFNDKYQGIPVGGYTHMVENMLKKDIPDGLIEVRLGTDFFKVRDELSHCAEKIVYTGPIDEFFDRRLGSLEFRSLRFETEVLDEENYQGNAVVNYTEYEIPYTRIIEHKHFEFGNQKKTVITREYPAAWSLGDEPYYPVNDEKNNALCEEYKKLAQKEAGVIFGGRLGRYKYFDMHQVVADALEAVRQEVE